MEILEFDDLSAFKKITLDEETLMLYSKCGKYSFYINFKDEIKGVDYYELAIATQTSSGYINKSGTANVIKKAVLDTLAGNEIKEETVTKQKVIAKAKPAASNKTNTSNKLPFYAKKRGRK